MSCSQGAPAGLPWSVADGGGRWEKSQKGRAPRRAQPSDGRGSQRLAGLCPERQQREPDLEQRMPPARAKPQGYGGPGITGFRPSEGRDPPKVPEQNPSGSGVRVSLRAEHRGQDRKAPPVHPGPQPAPHGGGSTLRAEATRPSAPRLVTQTPAATWRRRPRDPRTSQPPPAEPTRSHACSVRRADGPGGSGEGTRPVGSRGRRAPACGRRFC